MGRNMNKFLRLIQAYLVISFPFVVAFGVFGYLVHTDSNMIESVVRNILSFIFLTWIAVLCIFLVLLIILPSVRESTIRRLANLKERDEREQYITGKAARASYIAGLSMMIILFFISVIEVSIHPVIMPTEKNLNGAESHILQNKSAEALEIGFEFSFFDNREKIAKDTFSTNSFKLSSSAIILILMVWQLLIFNLTARKIRFTN